MSKLPLDLSKFKKIKADQNTTTFQHDAGHQITVAHNGLSEKMKAALSKLPMEQPQPMAQGGKVRRFADGGPSSDIPLPWGGMNPDQQAAYVQQNPGPVATTGENPNNPGPSVDAEPVDPASDEAQSSPTPDNSAAGEDTTPDSEVAPGGSAAPANSSAQDTGQVGPPNPFSPQGAQQLGLPGPMSYADHKQAALNNYAQEDAAWLHDLNNQHITPETYSSLFANKDTLGKIGTIFGLLVSGAGSGLSHQSNALMDMMNREIDRDMEAQKNSKANAQNYLQLTRQQEMQKAQIALMQHQGPLTDAQTKATLADANSKAWALAQSKTLLSTYQDLVNKTQAMPEGPQKEVAKQQLGLVYSKIGDKISNVNDQAAGASAYYNTLFGGQGAPQTGEQSFQKQMSGMRMMGPQGEARAKDLEEKHFPGLPGQASVPLTPDDRNSINSGIDFDQKLHRFMDWTSNHSGDLNPSDKNAGQALASELQGAYRQATHGGVYKEGEQNFISKLIDQDPTKFFNNIRVMPQLKAIAGENQSRVNQLVKSKGFSGYSGAQPQQTVSGGPPDGATGTYQGQPVIRQNGQWVRR